ncbi:MAG: M10 family metallopeptidase C-terminal domain-containing protein [Rhodobacteraceae bacterium]|nr:M10 family metallopeptidase C-terminal domain-containing protein [Paracoccaceae bacterium]
MSGTFYGTTAIAISGDDSIDGIITGHRWSSTTIYYSFPSSNSVFDYDTDTGVYTGGRFSALTTQQEDAANFALNADLDGGGATTVAASAGFSVEGFTGLTVTLDTTPDTTSQEQIRYANTTSALVGTARVADFPGDYITASELDDNGDVWFNSTGATPTAGNFDWATVLHETGHALGLKHGHAVGGTVNGTTALPAAEDSLEFSVMTYNSYIGQDRTIYNFNTTEAWGAPQTYMMNDISALQYLYGADFTTNSGNTTYSWNPGSGDTLVNGEIGIDAGGNVIFATIWDGGGTDTYDLSAYASDLTIDLTPGGWSIFDATQLADLGATGPGVGQQIARGSIFNARLFNGDARSLIENATGGSGDDEITGNATNNTLTGNGGDDTLRGGDGNDTLLGGAGSDTMFGEDGDDTFRYSASDVVGASEYLNGGSGNDRVLLTGAGTFSFGNSFDVSSVEEIEFNADGIDGKTMTMGSQELDSASEWLNVHIDGNNTLGADDTIEITMTTSNLTLAGWTFEDWKSASAGANNTDRIYIWGSISANTITGSSEDDIIDGGGGNDTINGGDGDDILTGGAGTDTLNGDGGNDTITSDADGGTYNGGAGNDLMYSASGAEWMDGGSGTDTIDHTAVDSDYTFNMATGLTGFIFESFENFENAIMGDGDDIVTGTSGANVIRGGLGNDTIDDGAGGDTIFGEGGDDLFLAGDSNFGDGDSWDGGTGTDTLSYQNRNWGSSIVTFDLSLGTATFNGFTETFTSIENFIGSGGNDIVTGSAGTNVISLRGGNDTLIHNALGGDSYDGGSGIDTLHSNVNWVSTVHFSLSAGRVTFIGSNRDTIAGFENLEIGGSSQISGDSGNNVLTALSTDSSHANVINGLGGNDTISGGAGDDILNGGSGNDTINGGNDNDTIDDGSGSDTVSGGDGDDLFLAGDSDFGNGDTWDGGAGIDTLSFQNHDWGRPPSDVVFDLAAGTASYNVGTETLTSIENFIGSDGVETIRGSNGINVIDGRDGDDTIDARLGADTINGGAGDDIIIDEDGFALANGDTIDGGAGNDTLVSNLVWSALVHFNLATGRSTFDGDDIDTYTSIENVWTGGRAQITGDNNANILIALSANSGHDNLISGGGGNDTIVGGGGNDLLNGDDGDDNIEGGTEDDLINGGDGNDFLFGEDGDDTLNGGTGNDTLSGGDGDDMLDGGFGTDTVNGGAGNDTISIGSNHYSDDIDGGSGTDLLDVSSQADLALVLDLGAGSYTLQGPANTITGVENVSGTGLADQITGDGNANVLSGNDGDDQINGGAGNDTLNGGDGDDVLDGGAGIDTIFAGGGNDTIIDEDGFTDGSIDTIDGGAGNDTLYAGGTYISSVHFNLLTGFGSNGFDYDMYINIENVSAGGFAQITGDNGDNVLIGLSVAANHANTINGNGGNDTISGGGGDDILNGDAGNDTINGGSENDQINGGTGDDTLNGDDGDDTLNGGNGIDRLEGGDGNDVLDGGHGKDDAFGGAGRDRFVISANHYGDNVDGGSDVDTLDLSGWLTGAGLAASVNLITGVYEIVVNSFGDNGTYTINSIENVFGTAYDDTIQGDGRRNLLRGNDGNDAVVAGGGNDRVYGGGGNDTLSGRDGNDRLYGDAGNDILNGESGADRLTGGSGADQLRGGAGNDLMEAGRDDDILIGGTGNDTMSGGSGVDQMDGGAGRDDLQGGAGDDIMTGGGGHDVMDGGGNNDQMEGGGGDDQMNGGTGGDNLLGGSGNDIMNGNAGGDVLDGGTGKDVVDGGAGNDRLYGGDGRDTVLGGAGNDRLYGGNGDDVLDGGAGDDLLDGDAGSDKFVLMVGGGNDVIRDFTDDVDTLRLDQALWAGPLTRQQVVDTFATAVGDDILFIFAGGESIEVRGAAILGLAAMYDDIALI